MNHSKLSGLKYSARFTHYFPFLFIFPRDGTTKHTRERPGIPPVGYHIDTFGDLVNPPWQGNVFFFKHSMQCAMALSFGNTWGILVLYRWLLEDDANVRPVDIRRGA